MNELSIYEPFSSLTTKSKKEIDNLSTRQADYVKEVGESDKTWAFLHKLENMIKKTKSLISDDAVNQVKEGVSYHGVDMKVKCKGDWDYSNDAEWVRLNQLIKDRELFLKGVKESFDTVNSDGEVVKIFPPIRKWSKDFIEGKF
jgi:hypothetical protein